MCYFWSNYDGPITKVFIIEPVSSRIFLLAPVSRRCRIFFPMQNYTVGIRGHYHESSDCFEYPKKSLLKSSHPIKYLPIFPTQKNPGIKSFDHPRHLKFGVPPPPPPLVHLKSLTTYRAFSLTWPAAMQIYWNKRKFLHKKRVQLPQDSFHCFGTPIWLPWRHVKTLYCWHSFQLEWLSYLVTSMVWVARLSCLLRMSSESVKPSRVHVAYLVPRSCSRRRGT